MKALVVGAGIGGLATALALELRGVTVHLVERRHEATALGSGITLIGPALRALDQLGLAEACIAQGYPITTFQTLDHSGDVTNSFPLPAPEGSNGPGIIGMMRPALQRILLDRARESGIPLSLSTEIVELEIGDTDVGATFASGESARFDLVVGADGLRSSVRRLAFGDVPLEFRGQGCVRVVLTRPASLTGEVQYRPAGEIFTGFTPISEDSMYMYVSFPVRPDETHTQPELRAMVRDMLTPFRGLGEFCRDQIDDSKEINFTTFSTVLVPEPWVRGRVVLVGDAAHAPTPQLAAGAAMCLEDAVALAEELTRSSDVDDALAAYSARRFHRCKYVVETAGQISHWQVSPTAPGIRHEELTNEAMGELAKSF